MFGAAGLVLSVTVFPLLYLLPLGSRRRVQWARSLLQGLFPSYIGLMEKLRLIRVRTTGAEALDESGQLIVANHPSLLDVVYLIALARNANCVVKTSLFYNPFTAGVVRAAGYIRNDSADLVEECAAALLSGESLIIFPEGTRTDPDRPFKFLRGAANIALQAGTDIRPVVIRCKPARLMKHQAWHEMSKETLEVTLTVCPPLRIGPYTDSNDPRPRMSRRLTRDLENIYLGNQ
ncbi:MAG: lysophospholipid acyltransferase family protein [Halioglobus sp.]|nr:lysophospholipid acyltransferase family protein [Halioglobus sp.]